MHGKLAGLPVWAWVVIGVAGIGAGLWLRSRVAGGQTAAASTTATDYTTSGSVYPDLSGAVSGGGAGSGGGLGAVAAPDYSTVFDAFNSGAQTASQLIGQGASLAQSYGYATGTAPSVSAPATGNGGYTPPTGYTQPPGVSTVLAPTPIPSSTTVAQKAAAEPYGGIAKEWSNAQGTQFRQYASGRLLEKATGKNWYVVKA